MKFKKKIFVIFFLVTAACGTMESVKKGLTGEKTNSTDEFLVKKKDPLVLPPGFNDLPAPNQSTLEEENQEETDISKILKIENDDSGSISSESGNLEESIIKKINEN